MVSLTIDNSINQLVQNSTTMHDLSKFQRMMVAMDLTEMDAHVVRYAEMIAKCFEVEAVYFFHAADSS